MDNMKKGFLSLIVALCFVVSTTSALRCFTCANRQGTYSLSCQNFNNLSPMDRRNYATECTGSLGCYHTVEETTAANDISVIMESRGCHFTHSTMPFKLNGCQVEKNTVRGKPAESIYCVCSGDYCSLDEEMRKLSANGDASSSEEGKDSKSEENDKHPDDHNEAGSSNSNSNTLVHGLLIATLFIVL